MPVVCFCEEDKIGWVADGSALDARGKRGLVITPGAKQERDMTRAKGSMHVILKFLAAHVDEWDTSVVQTPNWPLWTMGFHTLSSE